MKPNPIVRHHKTAWTAQLFAVVLLALIFETATLHAQTRSLPADGRTQIEKAASIFMAANSARDRCPREHR